MRKPHTGVIASSMLLSSISEVIARASASSTVAEMIVPPSELAKVQCEIHSTVRVWGTAKLWRGGSSTCRRVVAPQCQHATPYGYACAS